MARREEPTNEQWVLIEPLIPVPPRRADGRGRPWRDTREILNGSLWILRSGARWPDWPGRFPPDQTCQRRCQQWVRDRTLRQVLEALATGLRERGERNLSECFIDGSCIVAKKGLRRGKEQAGQGYEAHGGGRLPWFSVRRLRSLCYAA
jgi:transposase